jgi:hypothetical protein
VEGSAPFETKEEMSKAQYSEKEDGGGAPGLACTLSENCSGWAALRREQLESNHCDSRATGKEGKANHRHPKPSPWKRRNPSMPVGYSGQTALRRLKARTVKPAETAVPKEWHCKHACCQATHS